MPLLAQDQLALAPDQIGLGLSLISLAALLLAYPSGLMVDRLGRKAVIVPAMIVTGVSVGLFAVASNYAWFLVACAVWSIGLGFASDAPGAYAADTAPPGMNAAVMSTYRTLADCGYVIGPLVLGIIADGLGAPTALLVTGLLLLGSGVLFGRFAPETYSAGGARAGSGVGVRGRGWGVHHRASMRDRSAGDQPRPPTPEPRPPPAKRASARAAERRPGRWRAPGPGAARRGRASARS